MKKTLFVGDINVDVIMGGMASPPIVDREVPCESWDVVMGASTVICACAYASLGGDVSFAGLCGHDEYGDFMIRGLHEFGIDTELVRRTDKLRTGVTVNMIHANTRTQATYPGTIAAFDGSWLNGDVLARFDHVHFGGVCLEYKLQPHITRLLKEARQRGVTTSLDNQWDATEQWQYMDDWLPLLNWLFLNEDEAMSLVRALSRKSGNACAAPESPLDACRRLAELTPCPLVKLGREGVLIWEQGHAVHVPPVRVVEPVDTTGAGDTFDASFLYATLEKGIPLRAAAAFANAAAARSCLFTGGTAARSSFQDVLRFKDGL